MTDESKPVAMTEAEPARRIRENPPQLLVDDAKAVWGPVRGALIEYAEAGQLVYRSLDGTTSHWPGPDPWSAERCPDRDLFELLRLCRYTLWKVEAELVKRDLAVEVVR